MAISKFNDNFIIDIIIDIVIDFFFVIWTLNSISHYVINPFH